MDLVDADRRSRSGQIVNPQIMWARADAEHDATIRVRTQDAAVFHQLHSHPDYGALIRDLENLDDDLPGSLLAAGTLLEASGVGIRV
jgi:hypothetical protein